MLKKNGVHVNRRKNLQWRIIHASFGAYKINSYVLTCTSELVWKHLGEQGYGQGHMGTGGHGPIEKVT